MTKESEVKMLDSMIKSFGPDSYLGPWFAEIRDTLVRDISDDVCMTAPMPRRAMLEAERIIQNAKDEASTIKKQANEYAKREIDKADKQIADRKQYVKSQLNKIAGELYF